MEREPLTSQKINAVAGAYWQACALHTAVVTGITAELSQGPATAAALASATKLDQRAVGLLLTALLHLGIVEKNGALYAFPPGGEKFFTPGHPQEMTHMVWHLHDLLPRWQRLPEALKSGGGLEGEKDEDKFDRPHFYRAMRDTASQQASGVAARLGFRAGQHLLDLGGGPGVWAYTFCDEVPGLRATVFDLLDSREAFAEEASHHSRPDAVSFLQGDYRKDSLGGPYDLVWLSQVLHGEGPETALQVVRLGAEALKPRGALYINEFIVDPEGKGHPFAALFSLNMLVNTRGGQSYSQDELRSIMQMAGLSRIEVLGPTAEGRPARLMRGVMEA